MYKRYSKNISILGIKYIYEKIYIMHKIDFLNRSILCVIYIYFKVVNIKK